MNHNSGKTWDTVLLFLSSRLRCTNRQRKEAYEWIYELAVDISARSGKNEIDPTAWRVSARKWMEKKRMIVIRKSDKVLPYFLLKNCHNLRCSTGYVSYRRSNNLKALELRLELNKAANIARPFHENLQSIMGNAKSSRTELVGAQLRSGWMKKWLQDWEADRVHTDRLIAEIPEADNTFELSTQKEMESWLVNIHRTQLRLQELSEKYKHYLDRDQEEVRQHREDLRAASQSRP